MNTPTAFIVLFQGRSGSSYLIDALASHPQAVARGEGLVRLLPGGASAQLAWTQAFFAKRRPAKYLAAGFKTKLSDVLDADGFAACLTSVGCRIVHLDRLDVFKQAVSWMRADLLYAERGIYNTRDVASRPSAMRLDPDVFERRLRLLEEGRDALQAYIDGLKLPTLHLSYERLFESCETVLMDLQAFLGLPPRALTSAYVKVTSDDLAADVPNLGELRAVARKVTLARPHACEAGS